MSFFCLLERILPGSLQGRRDVREDFRLDEVGWFYNTVGVCQKGFTFCEKCQNEAPVLLYKLRD